MGKYTYEELQQRPEWNDWLEIKKYIPNMTEKNDQTVPPEYGYIVDKFRQKYGIYISVMPKIDPEIDTERTLSFRFNGRILYLDGISNIIEEVSLSGRKFSDVMRQTINKAIDILNDETKMISMLEDNRDPSIPYLEVTPSSIRVWDSGTVSVNSNTDWNVNE